MATPTSSSTPLTGKCFATDLLYLVKLYNIYVENKNQEKKRYSSRFGMEEANDWKPERSHGCALGNMHRRSLWRSHSIGWEMCAYIHYVMRACPLSMGVSGSVHA
mmetsp:Transcript_28979/g.63829  ORF Transcript_28979/g.63829 Transcript_28979/m.63829 type:complete len:105 (-) Transcript_28979:113-427(-)